MLAAASIDDLRPDATAPRFAVYRVLPECIDLIWSQVEPLLAKAIAREHGRYTTAALRAWCLSGAQQLWVVSEPAYGRVIAAGLVNVYRHPTGKRAAALHLLAGSRAREWAEPAWNAWLRASRLAGVTEMHIVGRKGWRRIVGRFGFQPAAVILTREEA